MHFKDKENIKMFYYSHKYLVFFLDFRYFVFFSAFLILNDSKLLDFTLLIIFSFLFFLLKIKIS